MATEMAAHLQLWMHRVWGYLLTKVFHVLLAGEVYASPHKLDKVRGVRSVATMDGDIIHARCSIFPRHSCRSTDPTPHPLPSTPAP